jgi:DNA-binding PadR family transcriptional regulator
VEPITEPVLLILLSLATQPRHGYAILRDTEQISDGRVHLSTGTLYGALRRLLDDGWIERYKDDDTSRGNLQTEVSRLKQLTRAAALRVARKET